MCRHWNLPYPLHDSWKQNQPEVSQHVCPPNRTNQSLSTNGVKTPQERTTLTRKQCIKTLERPVERVGSSIQDQRPLRQPFPVQLHQGAGSLRSLGSSLGNAGIQAEAV